MNAQLACNEQNFWHPGPMFGGARDELVRAGVSETPKVVLADAG
jgi:hypothetical protein